MDTDSAILQYDAGEYRLQATLTRDAEPISASVSGPIRVRGAVERAPEPEIAVEKAGIIKPGVPVVTEPGAET